MIEARCIETNQLVYVLARDIDTHDATIDSQGHITFFESNSHKYYKTVVPWPHGGLEDFIDFVDRETSSSELDNAA